jgi:hypothetical protein
MRRSKKTVFAGAAVAVLAIAGLAGAQDRTPDVRMSRQLVADASAFETFMSKASAIQPGFPNGKAVAEAVKVGASHDFRQLESGMIAYAAMAALQEPTFTAGVERAARDEGRENLARRLTDQPEAALYLPAAERAGARAAAALATRGQPLADDGRRVKQAAYDVQHQSWSKAKVADAAGRLARAKQLSAVSFSPTGDDKARLYHAVSARPANGADGPPTAVLARALAVAALAVLDEAGDDNAQNLQPLLTETRSASCLKMAKLNLFQCLAVAGPHYEDVFCLGQHAMIDPGQCVNEAAGLRTSTAAR